MLTSRPRAIGSNQARVTSVASLTTNQVFLQGNESRAGASFYNDSTAVLYLKFGQGASSTSYSVQIASQKYYETPWGYTGLITGAWATANGSAYVTEFV